MREINAEITDIKQDEKHLLNPFPGLRAFNIDEGHLFFGREGQTDEVLLKLSESKFVAVIGASGSGKSSFMYCGVIPILYGGFLTEAGSNWNVVVTRPGGGPIDNLADSLLKNDPFYNVSDNEEKLIRKTITSTLLRSSSMGLVESVTQFKSSINQNTLILVDQFEELFRFKKSEEGSNNDESLAFVNLLLNAVNQSEVPIFVALTMRSDFIGDCAQFPELTKYINDSHYLIPQMTREQKRLAIMGPVAVGGGEIAPRLVQQLLNDLGDNPDQLPILQHSLMRTWGYWTQHHEPDEPIDLRHYEAIGQMSEALSQHANEAYDELSLKQREICEVLFKALTEKGSDNHGIRRPTKLSVIASIAGVPEKEVSEVIETFRRPGRSLLMPPSHFPLTSNTIVDISHESLMRIWVRLKTWVEEEGESAQLYLRLSEASAMFHQGKTGLWRSPDLQVALNWKAKQKPTLVWAQRYDLAYERALVFLNTSNEAYETEQRNKEMMQKKALKRARIVAIILGTAALISIGFLVYSIIQKIEADEQREAAVVAKAAAEESEKHAQEERDKAKHQTKLAEDAKLEADRQTDIARTQEKEAKRQSEIAEINAREARKQQLIANIQRQAAEKNEKEANNQKALADKNANEAYRLRLLSIAQSMSVKSTQIQNDTMRKALLAKHAYLWNKNNGGNIHNHDVYDGLYYALKLLEKDSYNSMKGHTQAVRSMTYDYLGNTLFTAGSDGRVIKWDMRASEKYPHFLIEDAGVIHSISLSKNDRWLAVAGDHSKIQLLDLQSPKITPTFYSGHKGTVFSIAFLPDNNSFVSIGADTSIYKWTTSSTTPTLIAKGNGKLRSMAIHPEGKLLAVGDEKGAVSIYNLTNNTSKLLTDKKGKAITSINYSPDGLFLAIGDESGVVKVYDAKENKLVVNLTGHTAKINDIKFSFNNMLLATASFDGSVRVWDLKQMNEQPLVLKDHTNWVWSIAFSPDGNTLVAGCFDHLIRVWPTGSEIMAEKICGKLNRNMSTKEWNRYAASDIPYEITCPGLPKGDMVMED